MNICPVRLAAEPQTVVKSEENIRQYALKDAPIPPKDEVSFGADRYSMVISEITNFKVGRMADAYDLRDCYRKLYNALKSGIAAGEIKATKDFSGYKELTGDFPTIISTLEEIFDSKSAGKFIEKLQKEGSIVLAKKDCMPVLEMKYNGKAKGLGRKLRFMPDNLYEVRFNSEGGAQNIIFGVNGKGEITFKQLSDMAEPQYTSFYNKNGRFLKIKAKGEPWTGNFRADYLNYEVGEGKNIFKTLLLRLIQH